MWDWLFPYGIFLVDTRCSLLERQALEWVDMCQPHTGCTGMSQTLLSPSDRYLLSIGYNARVKAFPSRSERYQRCRQDMRASCPYLYRSAQSLGRTGCTLTDSLNQHRLPWGKVAPFLPHNSTPRHILCMAPQAGHWIQQYRHSRGFEEKIGM